MPTCNRFLGPTVFKTVPGAGRDRSPCMVGAAGFEPATSCSQSRRATGLRYAPLIYLVPDAGIEPATVGLQNRCSAI